MGAVVPGVCRYCGCTQDRPCRLHDGDECSWIDGSRTVCSAPGCVCAEAARVRAARIERPQSRYAGWGYGAILEDLRKRRRRSRRGRGKAA